MNNPKKGQTKHLECTREHGITLVALIITIIILIILAAVTINSLTHDGLADLAVKSTQEYQSAQTNEMEKLNEIDTMVKETLKNIEDGTTTPKPGPGDDKPPTTPDFSETIELVSANIGASIDYVPKANQSYSSEAIYSGHSSAQNFTSGSSGNNGNLSGGWSIWSIDGDNIYLISDNATSQNLTLENHLGYNNGVTLLDNICDTCFTDKTTYANMKGQNLKLEDVLAVKSSSTNNNYASQYGTTPYSYTFTYPYIWNQYEKSDTSKGQGAKDWENNRSTPYDLTTNTTATSQSYNPYYSLWYNNNMNTSSAWSSPAYFRMVMTPAQSKTYWLSSRYVYPNVSTMCFFGLQYVYSSGVGSNSLYYRTDSGSASSSNFSYAVRPLVVVPLGSCLISQNDNRHLPHRT